MHLQQLNQLILSPVMSIEREILVRFQEKCPTLTSVHVGCQRWIFADVWKLQSALH